MLSEVPTGWGMSTLQELCYRPISYGVLKPGDYVADGRPMLRIQDVKTNFEPSLIWRISSELDEEYRRTRLNEGDIIFSVVGTLGEVKEIDKKLTGANISRAFSVIGADKEKICLSYLVQFLKGSQVSDWVAQTGRGGAQKVVNLGDLRALSVPLPPLNEQQRIAEILSSVDASIQATQAVIEQAERVKLGLMGNFFNEPQQSVLLESISSKITKGTTPTTAGFGWEQDGIPYIKNECVSEEGFKRSALAYISEEAQQALKRSIVYPNDLLITIVGNVGRVVRVPSDIKEANINQNIAKVTISDDRFCVDYIKYFLQSPYQQEVFSHTFTAQAQPQLTLGHIKAVSIPLVDLEEQERISAVLLSADDFIAKQKAIVEHQTRVKKGLMDDLLTGKVRTV